MPNALDDDLVPCQFVCFNKPIPIKVRDAAKRAFRTYAEPIEDHQMTRSSPEQEFSLSTLDYPLDCTGNVVAGDTILFTEFVFGGSYRKPELLGERTIAAEVLQESYGEAKQQHTFTLKVLASDGIDPLAPGSKIFRKGRNVYRYGTCRMAWADEAERKTAQEDKYVRGDAARAQRARRLLEDGYEPCF